MTSKPKLSRREQILTVLTIELEKKLGLPITTSSLANAVGVSEAALYRHFASKAKMFEALINYAEESIFSLVNRILEQETDPTIRCYKIINLILSFSEKNPGITRLLIGDILLGENERLHLRVTQFFERIELQIRQILREANLTNGPRPISNIDAAANQMLIYIEGKLSQFVISSFKNKPTEHLEIQWGVIKAGCFR
ncbi:MAG: nucleoid occlusion factor SlmA [Legionellales bacterium]|jgi:TetR/AcrR family transcriptional regulator|nr:nucleoid occlusion factor SlmA [Legionellales bacterium]|tara:strand:- start:206 stop:796 length:591 start_codon:yes stop_codon:yes gene_type:complete